MDDFDEVEEHESYGVIGWSRQTTVGGPGCDANLFGSDLAHHNLISISVKQASKRRGLSQSWIHGGETICEVLMSQHQFAEFITSPNMGDGTPCTVHRTQALHRIQYPSHKTEGQLHSEEFRKDVKKFGDDSKEIEALMQRMAGGGAIKKGDFVEMRKQVVRLIQNYEQNMPFVEESFQKAMAKTVASGKAEIEAYIEKRIRDAGVATLGFEPPGLVELTDDERADAEYFIANPE